MIDNFAKCLRFRQLLTSSPLLIGNQLKSHLSEPGWLTQEAARIFFACWRVRQMS